MFKFYFAVAEEILHFENFDLEKIVTAVKVEVLEQLLIESKYDQQEIEFLVEGFRNGFSLQYVGNRKVIKTGSNLKLRVGSPIELWNKVMFEVQKGRYAGPFNEVPFEHYIQSPIGLVPKDKGKKTRLIFHLSYPRSGDSVNSQIPKEFCSVNYPDFDKAVRMCLGAGKSCFIGKSDMSAAFRNIGMCKKDWPLMVMKAKNPEDGKWYYFIDKCMPFGSSISCAIFQRFSNAVALLVKFRTSKRALNYLDNFFFTALKKLFCDSQLRVFLQVCEEINFPVALEKTFWGSTLMTFLGLLLDTKNQLICIPLEKIMKALDMINLLLDRKGEKVKVLEVQKLCGFLNFLCKCIIPGRVSLRRMYICGSNLQPHHHVKLTAENKLDLLMWRSFLEHPSAICRPFLDCNEFMSQVLDMYSDASRNFELGFGAYCGPEWTFAQWNRRFMERCEPSIEFLELYTVAVAVLNWIKLFNNKRVTLFCDNEAVVHMINSSTSKCS